MNDLADEVLSKLGELSAKVDTLQSAVLKLQPSLPPTQDEFLTIREAAKEFKVSKATLYKRKNLHIRVGGKGSIRIRRSSLTRRDRFA